MAKKAAPVVKKKKDKKKNSLLRHFRFQISYQFSSLE
jgi:hypothetical protein